MMHALLSFSSRPAPALLAACLVLASAQADPVADGATEWWGFENNLTGSQGINLVCVGTETAKLSPEKKAAYKAVSGIGAANAGTAALEMDGLNVLKTGDRMLRLGEAQTFWIRVNLPEIPASEAALMARSRPRDTLRGIALQLNGGMPTGLVSGTGESYDVQVAADAALEPGRWYDIALRFDPSNLLSIDVYDAKTGASIAHRETTEGVPSSLPTSNAIGSGYFQMGAINTGSAGSSWPLPGGTLVEAAGVWNRCLSDEEVKSLSQPAGS